MMIFFFKVIHHLCEIIYNHSHIQQNTFFFEVNKIFITKSEEHIFRDCITTNYCCHITSESQGYVCHLVAQKFSPLNYLLYAQIKSCCNN